MLRRALFEYEPARSPSAIRAAASGAFTADTSAGGFCRAAHREGHHALRLRHAHQQRARRGGAAARGRHRGARWSSSNRISPFRGGELSRIFGTTKRLLVAEECVGAWAASASAFAAILAEEGHEPQRLMLCNLGRSISSEQGSVGELYQRNADWTRRLPGTHGTGGSANE